MSEDKKFQRPSTRAGIKKNLHSAFSLGTTLTILALNIGYIQAVDFWEVLNSFSTGFGQESYHIGAKRFANFSSDNHGSLLIGANLYLDSSSGGEELKIARTHNSPWGTSLAGSAIHMPGHQQLRQGGIDFYTRPPRAGEVAANEPFADFPASPSVSITATKIDPTTVVEKVEMRRNLRVAGDLYARGVRVGLRGDRGDTGDQGDRGSTGPAGRNGANGQDGPRGNDGAPGLRTQSRCFQGYSGSCGCPSGTHAAAMVTAQTGTYCRVSASDGGCGLQGQNQGATCCVCATQ